MLSEAKHLSIVILREWNDRRISSVFVIPSCFCEGSPPFVFFCGVLRRVLSPPQSKDEILRHFRSSGWQNGRSFWAFFLSFWVFFLSFWAKRRISPPFTTETPSAKYASGWQSERVEPWGGWSSSQVRFSLFQDELKLLFQLLSFFYLLKYLFFW